MAKQEQAKNGTEKAKGNKTGWISASISEDRRDENGNYLLGPIPAELVKSGMIKEGATYELPIELVQAWGVLGRHNLPQEVLDAIRVMLEYARTPQKVE